MTMTSRYPFGPYLAAAGWIALWHGQQIVDMYLDLCKFPGSP